MAETVLRCPTIVGRDDELAHLEGLLEVVDDPSITSTVLVGAAGTGKSRLVGHLVTSARDADVTLSLGRVAPSSARAPLDPLRSALLSCPAMIEAIGRSPSLRGLASHLAPLWDQEPAPEPSPVLLAHCLAAGLADAGGGVFVIEDLHDADPETQAVIASLADEATRLPIALVVTARPDHGVDRLLDEIAGRGRTLTIGALSTSDALVAAAACLQISANQVTPQVRDLVALADGLPLLVEDLLSEAVAQGRLSAGSDVEEGAAEDAGTIGVPGRFARTVRRRLEHLDEDVREVVEAAALLGGRFDALWLAGTVGMPPDVLARALGQAAAVHLLATNGSAFRHALTRQVILDTMVTARRHDLAARALEAAQTLELGESHEPLIAELEVAAGRPGDAARRLRGVAQRALRQGAPRAAAEHLARARDLVLWGVAAGALARQHVEALVLAGDVVGAAQVAEETASWVSPAVRAAMLVAIARGTLARGHRAKARTVVDEAKALLPAEHESWASVWMLESHLALASPDDDRLQRARELATRAVESAAAIGDRETEAEAWLIRGRCDRQSSVVPAEEAFGRALALVADSSSPTRLRAIHELATIDMITRGSTDALLAALQEAERAGALVTAVHIETNVCVMEMALGHLDAAEERTAELLEKTERLGLVDVQPFVRSVRGVAAMQRGDRAAGEVHIQRALDLADGDPDVVQLIEVFGRCHPALIDEDRVAARAALERAAAAGTALMSDAVSGLWLLLRVVDGEVGPQDAELASGSRVEGARFAELFLDPALAALAAKDDPAEATARIEGLLPTLRDYVVLGLLSLRVTAEIAVRDGWGDPVAWLREVDERATALGFRHMASAARTLLRAQGAHVPRRRAVDEGVPDELRRVGVTAREYEVLVLMEDRPTNRELGERLHVSHRTIEKHVANLMMKTGLPSRRELAVMAEGFADGGAPSDRGQDG